MPRDPGTPGSSINLSEFSPEGDPTEVFFDTDGYDLASAAVSLSTNSVFAVRDTAGGQVYEYDGFTTGSGHGEALTGISGKPRSWIAADRSSSGYDQFAVINSDGTVSIVTNTSTGPGLDADGDGYPVAADCNDGDDSIHPGAAEVCDGVDNDCNTLTLEDEEDGDTWYLDGDGDTYGDPDTAVRSCTELDGYVSNGGDCNDGDRGKNREVDCAAAEACAEGGESPIDSYGEGDVICGPDGSYTLVLGTGDDDAVDYWGDGMASVTEGDWINYANEASALGWLFDASTYNGWAVETSGEYGVGGWALGTIEGSVMAPPAGLNPSTFVVGSASALATNGDGVEIPLKPGTHELDGYPVETDGGASDGGSADGGGADGGSADDTGGDGGAVGDGGTVGDGGADGGADGGGTDTGLEEDGGSTDGGAEEPGGWSCSVYNPQTGSMVPLVVTGLAMAGLVGRRRQSPKKNVSSQQAPFRKAA
ncbi:MAG: putative metal-binding motif-containing protein [Candidatus Gracilibacteria bacterium]